MKYDRKDESLGRKERMSSQGTLDRLLNLFGLMLLHKNTRVLVFSHVVVVINLVVNLTTDFENISFVYCENTY